MHVATVSWQKSSHLLFPSSPSPGSPSSYRMAENIDAQLKRMTEDLKEVIDHLNTSSGNQDNSDPVSETS